MLFSCMLLYFCVLFTVIMLFSCDCVVQLCVSVCCLWSLCSVVCYYCVLVVLVVAINVVGPLRRQLMRLSRVNSLTNISIGSLQIPRTRRIPDWSRASRRVITLPWGGAYPTNCLFTRYITMNCPLIHRAN